MLGIQRFILFGAACVGFWLSLLLLRKRNDASATGSTPADCREILESQFSTFLGIRVDVLGLLFYGLFGASLVAQLFFTELNTLPILLYQLLLVTGAFFFSLYLTFAQVFSLETWCPWTLSSTALIALLFAGFVYGLPLPVAELASTFTTPLTTLHIFAVVFGIMGVTISDVIFFRFLRRFRMTPNDKGVFYLFSHFLILGLLLFLISGLWLYVPHSAMFLQDPRFAMKLVVVFVIVVATLMTHVLIAPELTNVVFRAQGNSKKHELHYFRRLSYALGSIAAVSWYVALFLGLARQLEWSFVGMLMLYVIILFVAVVISQVIERTTASHRSLY